MQELLLNSGWGIVDSFGGGFIVGFGVVLLIMLLSRDKSTNDE